MAECYFNFFNILFKLKISKHCYVKLSIFGFAKPNFCQYTYVKSKTMGHMCKQKLLYGLFATHSLTYSSTGYGNMGCGVFKRGVLKERFLPKNQHTYPKESFEF